MCLFVNFHLLLYWDDEVLIFLRTVDPLKVSKQGSSSVPSSRTTCSNPTSLTMPSYSEKSASEGLPTPRTEGEILSSSNLKDFSFSELRSATKNFRPESLIGEGGFGYVFKGWIDEQSLAASKPGYGMVVAVKKLKPESFQGHKEWLVCFSAFMSFCPNFILLVLSDIDFCGFWYICRPRLIILVSFITQIWLS